MQRHYECAQVFVESYVNKEVNLFLWQQKKNARRYMKNAQDVRSPTSLVTHVSSSTFLERWFP